MHAHMVQDVKVFGATDTTIPMGTYGRTEDAQWAMTRLAAIYRDMGFSKGDSVWYGSVREAEVFTDRVAVTIRAWECECEEGEG